LGVIGALFPFCCASASAPAKRDAITDLRLVDIVQHFNIITLERERQTPYVMHYNGARDHSIYI